MSTSKNACENTIKTWIIHKVQFFSLDNIDKGTLTSLSVWIFISMNIDKDEFVYYQYMNSDKGTLLIQNHFGKFKSALYSPLYMFNIIDNN